MRKSIKSKSVNWTKAQDIKRRLQKIISSLDYDWLNSSKIFCVRSKNSKTRAQARIWGLPRLWQMVLVQKPSYIIEVISEKFDRLSEKDKDEVLLHELAHIPKNASGALLPHRKRGKGNFKDKLKKMKTLYKINL